MPQIGDVRPAELGAVVPSSVQRGPLQGCCRRCQWWAPDVGVVPEEGQCRSRPPHSAYGWPTTGPDEWCGAFRAAAVEIAPLPRPGGSRQTG